MPRGCGDRWKVGLLYGCDLAWSEMREMQKGFSQEVRLRRDMGLFQWRRGQLGREGIGIRKEWDRGKQGVDGKVAIRGGPAAWWSREGRSGLERRFELWQDQATYPLTSAPS